MGMTPTEAKSRFVNFTNLPFRQHQEEAINFIMESEKRFCVVEAATGSGKTLLAMTAGAMSGNLTYMVHSKVLQHQVTTDFPEARSLFGRGNYPCMLNPDLNCDSCVHTKNSPCLLKKSHGCVYENNKAATLKHNLKILNFDYFLSEANYVGKFSNAPFMIIDEADNLENALINFISLTFTDYGFEKLGLTGPARRTAKSKLGIEPWIDFAQIAEVRARDLLKKLDSEIDEWDDISQDWQIRKIKWRERVNGTLHKIRMFLKHVNKTWLYDDRQEGTYTFRPLWLTEELVEDFLWKHGQRFVLMSASFLPVHILSKTLGMPIDEIDYLQVPSTFPPDRRPIHINPVANITSKTKDVEYQKLIPEIRRILAHHENEKGLIHCVSYELGKMIMNEIDDKRLMIHNSNDRQSVLDYFINSPDPDVLVSPSMDRGVSFNDDLCRFIIIAKAPFLYLGDKVVAARINSGKIGNDWYQATMLLTILQMTGRGMRSETDRCECYILDEQIQRVINKRPLFLPEWWRDALW